LPRALRGLSARCARLPRARRLGASDWDVPLGRRPAWRDVLVACRVLCDRGLPGCSDGDAPPTETVARQEAAIDPFTVLSVMATITGKLYEAMDAADKAAQIAAHFWTLETGRSRICRTRSPT